jgi:hypothetical protein
MDSKMVVKYRCLTVPPSWFLLFWPCKIGWWFQIQCL